MIRASGLHKRFGEVAALDGFSTTLNRGESVVVLGPSGCGKTTLLRLIAGLEVPDQGVIDIEGVQVSAPGRFVAPHRRGLSMIFQDLALWPHMRVVQNVAFGLSDRRWRKRADTERRALETLEWVSLGRLKDRYPHQLSGGERQRLAIARALAPGHSYLLMDEPFSALDPILKHEMIGLVDQLKNSLGMTVLYVTHNLDEALALAERILLVRQGRLVGELDKSGLAGLSQNGLLQWYRENVSE